MYVYSVRVCCVYVCGVCMYVGCDIYVVCMYVVCVIYVCVMYVVCDICMWYV